MTTQRKVLIGAAVVLLVALGVGLFTQFSAMSYGGLRDVLHAQGATVQDDGLGAQPFLGGADHRLIVNGAGVDVFEYRTAVGAWLDARNISRDGTTITGGVGPFGRSAASVDFIAPPHWFHAGRMIVLYVGRDASLLALLANPLGPPFAGVA